MNTRENDAGILLAGINEARTAFLTRVKTWLACAGVSIAATRFATPYLEKNGFGLAILPVQLIVLCVAGYAAYCLLRPRSGSFLAFPVPARHATRLETTLSADTWKALCELRDNSRSKALQVQHVIAAQCLVEDTPVTSQ